MNYVRSNGRISQVIDNTTRYEGDTLSALQVLNLEAMEFNKISGLDDLTNLRELHVGKNGVKKIEGLNSLINLKVLKINNSVLDKIEGLENLRNLEVLDLSYNLITKIEGLEKLIKLRDLDLSNNSIIEIEGLENLDSLEKLNLSKNKLFDVKGLNKLRYLEDLDLSHNWITEMKGLKDLEKLKWLRIDDNGFSEPFLKLFGGFDPLTKYAMRPYEFVDYCQKKSREFKSYKKEIEFLFQDYPLQLNGKQQISQHLYEIIDNSENYLIREACLEKLIQLNLKDKKYFSFLEDLYISDPCRVIKYIAGQTLIKDFPEKSRKVILALLDNISFQDPLLTLKTRLMC